MTKCQNCDKNTNNPKFCSLSCSTSFKNKISCEIKRKILEQKYYKNPNLCKNCYKIISFEKRFDNKKFCSHSCSSKHINKLRVKSGWKHTSETKQKISKTTRINLNKINPEKFPLIPVEKSSFIPIKWKICEFTGKPYMSTPVIKNGKITKGRKQRSPYIDISVKEEYYRRSQFKFNVYHYPERFDLSLIEKHGWYSTPGTKKRGEKNTDGISRDHMYSVMDGFTNKIDPEIIAHPANCRLLQHTENIRKHRKSIISIEELMEKIQNW